MNDLVQYLTMTNLAHADAVCGMMEAYYIEDAPASGARPRAFRRTIECLLGHPDRGRVVLLQEGGTVVGYALLVPYWSNEFGGTALFVDELYVVPAARGRGIGRGLFAAVERDRPYDAVAVCVEVTPANGRARRLYESIGLGERANATLVREHAARP